LHMACSEGHLNKWIARRNMHGAPSSLLLLQAILVSIIMVVFFLIPSVNGSYWLLSVLAAQLYMLMYILMFMASIVLKLREPTRAAHYQIPGGLIGHLITAGLGLFGSIFAFLICFIPPSAVHIGNLNIYEITLVVSLLVLSFLPALLRNKKNPVIGE